MKRPIRLTLILAVGIVAMSSAAIFIRKAQADNVQSLVIAAYRLAVATLALTLPAARQQSWQDYAKLDRREIGLIIGAGILLGLHFATWVTSLAYTSVASSVVLVTTTPLWLGLASPILLGEPTPRLTWLGMALAIGGGLVIGLDGTSGGSAGTLLGNVLALMGAIFGAGYLLIGRQVREHLPLVSYLWVVYGTAGILLLGWTIVGKMPIAGFSPQTYLWLIALGLVPQLIGHSSANYAVRHLSATFVGVATLGEPIGSTILAIIFLDELPTTGQIIGGGLILAGIALASFTESVNRAGRSTISEKPT